MNQLSDVYIVATSACMPNAPVPNDQMESVLGIVGDTPSRVRNMILRSNGIRQRHYAIDPVTRQPTHSTAELAAEAVRALFADGIDPATVDVLACATSYPDQIMPGHGVMVHGLLPQLPACEVISNAGVCVAGMASMRHAYLAIRSGEQRRAIACAAETASAVMRREAFLPEIDQKRLADARPDIAFEKDFLRWMLSDGAGAVFLSNDPSPVHAPASAQMTGTASSKAAKSSTTADTNAGISTGTGKGSGDTISTTAPALRICWIELLSYAHEMPVCMYAGAEIGSEGRYAGWKEHDAAHCEANSVMSVKQDVKLLNENIVGVTVERALQRVLEKHPLRPEDIDHFLPHYSSGYFRPKLAEGLERIGFPIPQEKWFTNLASKGNTGSASIYIMLDEFRRTVPLKSGQKVLCYIPESGRFSSCFMLLEVV
ncbi:MAG: beta-ketoacyl-ACP synthase III [Lautropia sp.]|nr:beta-ketoacyl-ACP synthase III [Lautropia sp.]